MALQARSAGRGNPRLAAASRNVPRFLVGIGVVAFLAGAAVGIDALAPMFIANPTVATLKQGTSASAATVTLPVTDASNTTQIRPLWIWDGPVDGVAFKMSIPAIGYSATVLEGVANAQLERGPGHYPDSAWPGEAGNVGVAAHNVYWLSFNRLHAGDQVVIQTRHARYVYRVSGSKVVNPNDRSILVQGGPAHDLVLTTCYPLWAGAYAKQRLVFFAAEVGGVS